MKKIFVLLFVVLLNTTFLTVNTIGQGKAPYMTRTFSAPSIKDVEATTSGGSLTLAGDAGSEAKVEMYVSHDGWSAEQIKKVLEENYTIDIKVENGKLYAVAKQKRSITNWNRQGLSISFKITVSKQVDSNLQTNGGSIQINNLSGSQNFKTSGGSLAIENTSGNTVGSTSGGSINIKGSKDNINLNTSGGSISAKDCNGKIELKTSGGSLNMSNLNGDITASTSGGSVTANDINGKLKTSTSGGSMRLSNISGSVDASTSGGSMDVKIISVSDFVRLSNSGNISLTLPAGKGYRLNVKGNRVETSGLKDFRGSMESKSLDGTTGNGGAEINVKSSQRVRLVFE